MKLLDRYIAKTILSSIGLVTLMLAGLQVFILFVNQLDDLGKADYGVVQASIYVFLQTPYQVYLFFPMASLLGALVGLGLMANHSELVVMRASGMSIGEVTWAVLKAAMIIILIVTAIGELFIPKLSHFANDQKIQALTGGQTLRTAGGVWVRQHNDFVLIGAIHSNNTMELVYQFHFDDAHRLRLARQISKLDYVNGHWVAYDVAETRIHEESTQVRKIDKMIWDVNIQPQVLGVSNSEADEMTLQELHQFLRIQQLNHQRSALDYQLAYWQRLIQPLTTAVMMILAIPFIFGPLRSSTMGSKLLTGAVIGFGFHIINKFFGPLSQVFQWPAELAALSPTCFFALLGFYLMRKVK